MFVPDESVAQKIARYTLICLLVLLGAWMLRRFLPALCWAVVLAVGTSSLYDRWLAIFHGKRRHIWAAFTFTSIVGIVVIVPLAYGGAVALREAVFLIHKFLESSKGGIPDPPPWLLQLPFAGPWLQSVWFEYMGNIGAAAIHNKPALYEWTRLLSFQLLGRLSTLIFTLVTQYFVYLNRDTLRNDIPRVGRALFGQTIEGLLPRAAEAIRATVDGIVLVAVAEGAIMVAVYSAAKVPHPILFGAVTGIFAMVPFAAPVVFGSVALLLGSRGALGAAVGVLMAGTIVLFVADHFVRPMIIREGAKLPFLWVLLGILGGIESFGLVGIFLGPALMAALISLWRSGVAEPRLP